MCDSLLGPLSNSAQPSVVCNPILSASLETESWAVSHGCTSIALVRPSRKKNLQTMVPSRFMAAISTEEGGSLLFSVNAKLDNLLYCADLTVTYQLTLCILHQIFEDRTSRFTFSGSNM